MPYNAHFGLQDHPFALTPDVEFFFPSREHANIIASIEFALRREAGVIKVVGEVGTGKTLLCRMLIQKLIDTDDVAYINAPRADARSIIVSLCEEFGVKLNRGANPYSVLNRFLVEQHAKGRMAVVVVDEAQHLGKQGLEAVRLISNLETEKRKLLQIVMFGQTELDDLVRDHDLRQLNQRIVFSLNTKPMDVEEASRYIEHRIQVSRVDGVAYDIFQPDALSLIARATGGVPRLINILADKSLLVAFSEDSPVVRRSHVKEAIADTRALMPRLSRWHWPLGWKLFAGAAVLVLLAAGGVPYVIHHPVLRGWTASAAAGKASPAPLVTGSLASSATAAAPTGNPAP